MNVVDVLTMAGNVELADKFAAVMNHYVAAFEAKHECKNIGLENLDYVISKKISFDNGMALDLDEIIFDVDSNQPKSKYKEFTETNLDGLYIGYILFCKLFK